MTIEYHNQTICFIFNSPDIETFKDNFGYQLFKEKYGEILFKNEKIKGKNNFNSADYHIYLSVCNNKSCFGNFLEIVQDIFYMLEINNRIFGILTQKIQERYSEVEDEYPHYTISVINDTSEKVILFNYKNLMVIKEENSEYVKML